MNRVAKVITALQALLLAPLGVAKPGEAAPPSNLTESAAWQAALSNGTPESLQQFISRFPQANRLGEAFGLIVQGEVEAARSDGVGGPAAVQLSEAGLELLEHDFDFAASRNLGNQNEDERGLTPY